MIEKLKFTNLYERSDKYHEFIKLVEKSFGYNSINSYQIDFYPLVNPSNYQHCYLLMEGEEIVATCAYLERKIKGEHEHKVIFLGAITVNEKFRGNGLGKKIVEMTIATMPEVAWLGLWSDKKLFFNDLNFFDYGEQYFLPKNYLNDSLLEIKVVENSISKLTNTQKIEWKNFYQQLGKKIVTMVRDNEQWESIFHIYSAKYLEIWLQNKKVGYAILGKGMDLPNIIHEFFVASDFELSALTKLNQQRDIWLPNDTYNWDKSFLGPSLMIRKHHAKLWENWERDVKGTFLISGLDSI
jgi:predicted GNAT family N-acyltransferase